ncbi:ficolin-2-like isoform 2-T3 [Cochliomyia hominivorax]
MLNELRQIVEGNKNITNYLQLINERIDTEIASLSREIKKIKEVIRKLPADAGKEENDYSLYDNLWIVIQRREDGSIDFYRNWTEYKQGFGNPIGEFFAGLDRIHNLTNSRDHELLIILEEYEGSIKYVHYDHFLISDEKDRYRLKSLGKYSGTAGDHLRLHLNMFFTTKDRDNDDSDEGNCAEWFKGAWWYYNCMTSNLNGPYRYSRNLTERERGIGVTWGSYDEIMYSYKSSQMMLRSKKENGK